MAVKKGFDLSKLDTAAGANAGVDIKLYHPGTGEDIDGTITILGQDSDEFQRISRMQQKKRMEKIRKGGRGFILSPEEIEQNSIELLAGCSKGWSGNLFKDLPFSRDAAEACYKKFPWMREQVDTGMGDRANFIKG